MMIGRHHPARLFRVHPAQYTLPAIVPAAIAVPAIRVRQVPSRRVIVHPVIVQVHTAPVAALYRAVTQARQVRFPAVIQAAATAHRLIRVPVVRYRVPIAQVLIAVLHNPAHIQVRVAR